MKLAEAFNKANSSAITVSVLCGQSEDMFLTAYAGGQPPDVYYINSAGDLAVRGALVVLDDYIATTKVDLKNWPEVWKKRSSWQEKTYGLSMTNLSLNMAFSWNKQLFEEAGLDPEQPPTNWAEAEEYSKKTTKKDAAGNLIQIGWDTADGVGSDPTTWSSIAGFELYDMNTKTWQFDRPEMVAAMDFCARVRKEMGADQITAFRQQYGGWTASPNSSFPKGLQAMIVNGAWQPGELMTTAAPTVDKAKIGIGWTPTPDKPRKVQFTGGQSYSLVTGCKHPNEAWMWMEYLITKEAELLWIEQGQFMFGKDVRTDMRNKAKEVPGLDGFINILEEIEKGTVEFYNAPPAPGLNEMYNQWSPAIEAVMFGQSTAEEGCKKVQAAVQKVHDEALKSVE
jgi:multiple sugar transport system substrate-binding protein